MIEIINLKDENPKYLYGVYVDRRTPVGNPYHLHDEKLRNGICNDYETYFYNQLTFDNKKFKKYLNKLIDIYKRNKKLRLFCHCYPKRCHAETIKNFIEEILGHTKNA